MERKALSQLYEWKERKDRKPLIVYGARQVGKTWLIKEFAKRAFCKSVYINFEDEERLSSLFEHDFNIERILSTISFVMDVEIDCDTLLIFDEIQAVRRGVTSLKYFCEKAPDQYVVAAGSLLGISMHEGDSFPVGKVDSINLYPLDFEEFLWASGRKRMADAIGERKWEVMAGANDMFRSALREYYFVGGMPAVVNSFCATHNYTEVRRLQNEILSDYDNDFSKHAPASELPKIRMVWNSIYPQLAKENRKFVYGLIKQGGRAKEFENAIEWLIGAGLIYKVYRVKSAELPLPAFVDVGAFKLFMLDIGLFCAKGKLDASVLIGGNELFLMGKGAMTEQYVAQQLHTVHDAFLGYWSAENSSGEIDFLVQMAGKILPIEVKAEENLKSKSLRAFVERNPPLQGIRLSMSDYRQQDWMTNIPLYAIKTLWGENS